MKTIIKHTKWWYASLGSGTGLIVSIVCGASPLWWPIAWFIFCTAIASYLELVYKKKLKDAN